MLFFAALLAPPVLAPAATAGFVADDYPKALAEAKARRLPLFVEAWAPW
jgi:hypothetical protein